MLTYLRTIVTSRLKACELLYLLHNIKPVVRQGFYTNELEKVEAFCSKNNLHTVKAPYTVNVEETSGFSNRGKILPEESEKSKTGMHLVYISKDKEKALVTCLAETQQDHITAGLLLGYPKCCAEFFTNEYTKGNLNPIHKPTNPWTNLTQRDKDAAFLSHFPCSSECEGSMIIAKENFKLLQAIDKKTAEEMKRMVEEREPHTAIGGSESHNRQDV